MRGRQRPGRPRPTPSAPSVRRMSGSGVSPLRCDARTGQPWTPGQRLKNDLIFWTVRALLWCADRIPPGALLASCRVGGRLTHALLHRLRATARENLRRALPHADSASLARESFVHAGENLGLTLLLRRPSLRAPALVEAAPDAARLLRDTLAEGRGAVFISAHLGPFEWIAATIAELGHRPAIVVRESYDARLDPLVDAHRSSRGVEVIHRGRVGAAVRIVRALRAGKPVGFLPDLGGRVRSRPGTLFGQRVELPVGPERIATRARCPVLFGTLRPRPPEGPLPRFGLEVSRLDEPTEPSLGQTIGDALTRAIARCPEQWLWMAPRFDCSPPETRPAPRDRGLAGVGAKWISDLAPPMPGPPRAYNPVQPAEASSPNPESAARDQVLDVLTSCRCRGIKRDDKLARAALCWRGYSGRWRR